MKLAVIIGRFQPLHNKHVEMIQNAIDKYDKIIIFIGSAQEARTKKNPFYASERANIIKTTFSIAPLEKMKIIPIVDFESNEEWTSCIKNFVEHEVETIPDTEIFLVGNKKDDSSYYLDLFPEWIFDGQAVSNPLSATQIRQLWADGKYEEIATLVPTATFYYIKNTQWSF